MKISYNFFNTLIEAKSASIKRSRPEADNQKLHYVKYYDLFSQGMAPEYGVCYHDLKKEIKILGKLF